MKKVKTKFVHVNKHKIAANLKGAEHTPVLAVRVGRKVYYGDVVHIHGPSHLIDAEQVDRKPLSCGARVYLMTKSEISVKQPEGWTHIE